MEERVQRLEALAEESKMRLMSIETRVTSVEQYVSSIDKRLLSVEVDISALKAHAEHFATKADVANAKASIIMWVVTAIFLAQLLPTLLKHLGL